jgi:hypothetical protein
LIGLDHDPPEKEYVHGNSVQKVLKVNVYLNDIKDWAG